MYYRKEYDGLISLYDSDTNIQVTFKNGKNLEMNRGIQDISTYILVDVISLVQVLNKFEVLNKGKTKKISNVDYLKVMLACRKDDNIELLTVESKTKEGKSYKQLLIVSSSGNSVLPDEIYKIISV